MGPIVDPSININQQVAAFLDAMQAVQDLEQFTPATTSFHGNPVDNIKQSRAAVTAPNWTNSKQLVFNTNHNVMPNANLTQMLQQYRIEEAAARAALALQHTPETRVTLPRLAPGIPGQNPRIPTTGMAGGIAPVMLFLDLLTRSGDTNNSPEQQQMDQQRKAGGYRETTPARTGPGGLFNILMQR